jgi:GNAT superfamily N-acetyltransferase
MGRLNDGANDGTAGRAGAAGGGGAAGGVREVDPHGPLPVEDVLLRWAAQGPGGGSRAFVRGGAAAVAAPGLSGRDRLVLAGPPGDAVPLLRAVLPVVGPSFRPLGDRALIGAAVAAVPGLAPVPGFGWMHTARDAAPGTPARGVASDTAARDAAPGAPAAGPACPRWLGPEDAPRVAALLDAAFPASYAYPGRCGPGERWVGVETGAEARAEAGVGDGIVDVGDGGPAGGRLAAVAALAWCAPDVAFLAGVATAPRARGLGLGRAVCAFLLSAALAERPAAALIVDDGNAPARRLYTSLGLAYRPLGAASRLPG